MFPVSFNSTGATIPNLFLPIIRRVQNKRIGARSFRTNHKWGTYGEKLFISLKTTKYLYSEWLQCWRQNGLNISIWTQQYWNNEGLNKLNNFVFDHWTIITDHQQFMRRSTKQSFMASYNFEGRYVFTTFNISSNRIVIILTTYFSAL